MGKNSPRGVFSAVSARGCVCFSACNGVSRPLQLEGACHSPACSCGFRSWDRGSRASRGASVPIGAPSSLHLQHVRGNQEVWFRMQLGNTDLRQTSVSSQLQPAFAHQQCDICRPAKLLLVSTQPRRPQMLRPLQHAYHCANDTPRQCSSNPLLHARTSLPTAVRKVHNDGRRSTSPSTRGYQELGASCLVDDLAGDALL